MRRGIVLTVALALAGGGLVLLGETDASPVPARRRAGAAAAEVEPTAPPRAEPERAPLPANGPRAHYAPEPATAPRARPAAVIVEGFVLDEVGQPASHARVALGKLAGRCDAAGRFRLALRGPIDAAADLVAWLPGREPGALRAVGAGLRDARGTVGPLRVELGAALPSWSGRLVDGEGRPLKGWRIECRTIPEPGAPAALGRPAGELAAGRRSARTDDAGRFELRVADGRHRIRVSRGAARCEFERRAGEPLVLVVARR